MSYHEKRAAIFTDNRIKEYRENIRPYTQVIVDYHATALPKITIDPDGGVEYQYNLTGEAKSAIANIHKVIEMEAEKCREDMLTYGQGFSKPTSFPPYIEHVPYGEIYHKPGDTT